jgi:hypothetical protein
MTNMISLFLALFGAIGVFWVLSRLVVSPAYVHRSAREFENGQLEFAPNKRNYVAAILFVALLVYSGISSFVTSLGSPFAMIAALLWVAIAAAILSGFPGSILADGEGLQQVYWLMKKKHIAWADVSKVVIDGKRERVTIVGPGRAKIVFTRQLPDKERLLAKLGKHCADKLPTGAKLVMDKQPVDVRRDAVTSA